MSIIGTAFPITKDQAGNENELDIKFAKVGNDYLNTWNLERCLVIDDDISVSMNLGGEYAFTSELGGDADFKMTKVARKINESAHDIIYIESSGMQGEEAFDEDQASNLLYRKWLENSHHVQKPQTNDPLHKQLFRAV